MAKALSGGNLERMSEQERGVRRERAWLAYHSLPRVNGKPPSQTKLEQAHGLPHGVLSKIFNNKRSSVDGTTLLGMAEALRVTPQWLTGGPGVARAVLPDDERRVVLVASDAG